MINLDKITLGLCGVAALALASVLSGCVVRGGVAVEAPAPAVTVEAVPDYYVWDGYEYVGVVGGQYYYLGPGNVWIVCEPFRLARFHDWERVHPDWHAHAIHNDRYRHGYRDRDQDRHDHDYNH